MKKNEIIYGIHASLAALNNSQRKIIEWYCTKEVLSKIDKKITNNSIPKCKIVERSFIDNKAQNKFHQGIFLECNSLNEIDINKALMNNKSNILILDSLTDSQNVGAILRSAYLFGINLIFYNEKNSFEINATLLKSSSGAFEKINMIKIMNINNLIKELKKKNYWIIGLDSSSEGKLSEISKEIRKVIILGSESKGIRPLIKKNCDYLIKIPMIKKDNLIDSLNVSNAASIIFYELSKI